MNYSLSTHWHTFRHADGETLVEEALELGLDRIELGYDFTVDLLPGVQKMVNQNAVSISSVHNYCPVPVGAPMGHPELFTLADPDSRVRENALWHTRKTIEFAAEMGAPIVVTHVGNVKMRSYTRELIGLYEEGKQHDPKFDKLKIKMLTKRDKKSEKQRRYLYEGVEKLIPILEQSNMKLGIEILPTWESFPTEIELETLLKAFDSPHLTYWHDFGHSQIRQNLGLINHPRWLARLAPHLGGTHIHDVATPGMDHLMPPLGDMDFSVFRTIIRRDVPLVFEPSRRIDPDQLKEGIRIIKEAWTLEPDSEEPVPATSD